MIGGPLGAGAGARLASNSTSWHSEQITLVAPVSVTVLTMYSKLLQEGQGTKVSLMMLPARDVDQIRADSLSCWL
jgi:hypothetical protein